MNMYTSNWRPSTQHVVIRRACNFTIIMYATGCTYFLFLLSRYGIQSKDYELRNCPSSFLFPGYSNVFPFPGKETKFLIHVTQNVKIMFVFNLSRFKREAKNNFIGTYANVLISCFSRKNPLVLRWLNLVSNGFPFQTQIVIDFYCLA